MHRNKTLFILIITLAIFLRFFYLGKIPLGFYSDEAAYGYNAYSLLLTGKDEYGQSFPLAFKSFGDYKAPLYIYFMVPFIGIFGLNEFAVRLSSALLGVVVVALVFVLVKLLFKKNNLALLSSLLAATSPFSLQFNRMAHENNLVVFLVVTGILFLVKSLKSPRYIIFSLLTFALSIYTYHDARVFIPIFLILLFFVYRKYLSFMRTKVILAVSIFILLLIPFTGLLKSRALWSRPSYTIISSDIGINLRTNEERGEDLISGFFAPTIFHNKAISFSLEFLKNYLKHYSFDFLLFMGDSVKIYQTVGNGVIYFISLPFLILGLYFIFRKKFGPRWLLLTWLLLPPVSAALTRFVPAASRIFSIHPVISILMAIGLWESVRNIKNFYLKKILVISISLLFVGNTAYYLHNYYFNTQVRYAKEWHYGVKEVMEKVKDLQDGYQTVWFSKNVWGYIYPLFYMKYPPQRYHQQAKLSPLNEFGFGWVDGFDKYIFNDFPKDLTIRNDTLFIGEPSDFNNIKRTLFTIYYPNKEPAFYIADYRSL